MKAIPCLALLLPLYVAGSIPAGACCMVPTSYPGHIGQSAQQAVLFYAVGHEELILKINYHITGKGLPDRFAWIITVPNEPDAYSVASPKLFDEVSSWANEIAAPPARHSDTETDALAGAAARAGLEFGKPASVGPYNIQPVRALGRQALEGLNEWLAQHGFPTENPRHMAYFVDHRFTFLCIKVNSPTGSKTVQSAAGVAPLHLSFRTPRPYYPLKFSSRQGVFDLDLYILTRDKLNYDTSMPTLQRLNWGDGGLMPNVKVKSADFPPELQTAFQAKGSCVKQFPGDWVLNVVRTTAVNSTHPIRLWKDDIFFTLTPERPMAWMPSVTIRTRLAAAILIFAFVLAAAERSRVRRRLDIKAQA